MTKTKLTYLYYQRKLWKLWHVYFSSVLTSIVLLIGKMMAQTLSGVGLIVVFSVIYMHGVSAKTSTQNQDSTIYHMQQHNYLY